MMQKRVGRNLDRLFFYVRCARPGDHRLISTAHVYGSGNGVVDTFSNRK